MTNEDLKKKFIAEFSEAESFFKNKQFNIALEKYEILLKKNPNHVSVLNNIGLIYEKLEKFDKAINFYKKCNQIQPDIPILIHNLANLYVKLEKFNDALPLLKKIINEKLNNEKNSEKYALCLYNISTKEETKNFIEKIIYKYPKNQLLNGILGKSLLNLNFHKAGLEYIQKSTGFIQFNNNGIDFLK